MCPHTPTSSQRVHVTSLPHGEYCPKRHEYHRATREASSAQPIGPRLQTYYTYCTYCTYCTYS